MLLREKSKLYHVFWSYLYGQFNYETLGQQNRVLSVNYIGVSLFKMKCKCSESLVTWTALDFQFLLKWMEWKFKGMKEKLFGTMIFDNRFVISEVKIQFMKQKKNDLWNEHKNTKNLLAAHLKMNKNFVLNYIHKILFYQFF